MRQMLLRPPKGTLSCCWYFYYSDLLHLCSSSQPTLVDSSRTLNQSCWCDGTRQPPCSLSSEATPQSALSAGSRGCSAKGSLLRSATPFSRGRTLSGMSTQNLFKQLLSLPSSGTVCCRTGTLSSITLTYQVCLHSGQCCCPLLFRTGTAGQCPLGFRGRRIFNDVKSVDAFVLNRPLWVEFQKEQSTFAVDNQYMIGGNIFLHLLYYRYYAFCI